MMLPKWEALPPEMQCDAVRKYYDILQAHKAALCFKRFFDAIVSFLMLVLLSPLFLIISVLIILDSPGAAIYRQERVTAYGKTFRIYKFRTMITDADAKGPSVTVSHDRRITRIGKFLRRSRLDEIPQLLNILSGDMSFVGTRPESVKYVKAYTPVMRATLLLPAGVTSETSILYKDEYTFLDGVADADRVYIETVLPRKMKYNLHAIKKFSLWYECKILIKTVLAVLGKDYTKEIYPNSDEETEDSFGA